LTGKRKSDIVVNSSGDALAGLSKLLKKLERDRFFGEVVIGFRDGKVGRIEKRESIRIENVENQVDL
jgi:hypothetical protein